MANLDQGNNKNVSLSLIADYGGSESDSDDTETQSNDNANEDSDTAELSEMVLKNNIINACAHGPLSRPAEETTRHMIIDSVESGVVEYDVTEYRDEDSPDSISSSDSEVDSVKDVEEISSGDEESNKPEKLEQPKVHGELGLDDLPPIEDLAISLPEKETTKIGTIASIVERLVIVRALPGTPAVDLESVLFLDHGAKALGKVFDVFGSVTEPHYCVRFNSQDHVKERGIQPGLDVYIATCNKEYTNLVFVADLLKFKGSDASWLHDVEPPPNHVDYSDDEEERRANRARKEANKKPEEPEEVAKKKQEPRRNNRPSESSSRFGSGPSRGRPVQAGSRRYSQFWYERFYRPWQPQEFDMRTPPPHPDPFSAPPNFNGPMFPPPFNPNTPPPFGNAFQFGGSPRMGAMNVPPFRQQRPMFSNNFCNGQPQWNTPPPPPGT